jgi:hypothetical protein
MVTRANEIWLSIAGACLLLPGAATAHHSTAVFDPEKTIELRGVVVEFRLASPHSALVVDGRVVAVGPQFGTEVQRWELEYESLPFLRSFGIDAKTFAPGDAITVIASPHRDPDFQFAHVRGIVAANGVQYGLESSDRVYSPSLRKAVAEIVGGTAAQHNSVAVQLPPGVSRLNGRWQQPLPPIVTDSILPLNEAGRAARNDYDPKLSPANTCEPISIPDIFMAPFYLFDLRVDAERAVLHNEAYQIRRSVALSDVAAPLDSPAQFGRLNGRIEGETLVVDSHGYQPSKWGLGAGSLPFGAGADVPSSEQKAVVERYTVTADGQTLVLEYTVYDPAYMTMPYSGRIELTRVPETAQMYPYECDVESASMWSRAPDGRGLSDAVD